jgi:hypothetical protein
MGALEYALVSLEILGLTLQLVPIVGEQLKAATELATKICEVRHECAPGLPVLIVPKTMQENRETYEKIAD